MLNKNTDDECIFLKSDEVASANITKTELKEDQIYIFDTAFLSKIKLNNVCHRLLLQSQQTMKLMYKRIRYNYIVLL